MVVVPFRAVKDECVIVEVSSVGVRKKLCLELCDEANGWNDDESLMSVIIVCESMYEDGEDSFSESSRCEYDASANIINDSVECPIESVGLIRSKLGCDFESHGCVVLGLVGFGCIWFGLEGDLDMTMNEINFS